MTLIDFLPLQDTTDTTSSAQLQLQSTTSSAGSGNASNGTYGNFNNRYSIFIYFNVISMVQPLIRCRLFNIFSLLNGLGLSLVLFLMISDFLAGFEDFLRSITHYVNALKIKFS